MKSGIPPATHEACSRAHVLHKSKKNKKSRDKTAELVLEALAVLFLYHLLEFQTFGHGFTQLRVSLG
jgi:hypothetical protein